MHQKVRKKLMHQRENKFMALENKYNILNILKNVSSVLTGLYFHYKDVPKETMFERNITERIKLEKGRFDEIKEKNRR